MADNSDRPVDEYGEPIPTQAELDRERQRIEELRRASEEAAALERQLSTQLPTAPVGLPQDVGPAPMATEVAQVPSAPPLSLPVSKGRMYMGPAMTPEEELAFRSAPSLQSRVLVPPPTPEASAGAASRVAAMTAPEPISAYGGAPSPTSIYPEMRQFYAQQQIRKAVEAGTPISQAMQLYGPEFFARGAKPITPIEQARLDLAKGREAGIQSRFEAAEARRLGEPTVGELSEYRRNLAQMKDAQKALDEMEKKAEEGEVALENNPRAAALFSQWEQAKNAVFNYEQKFGRKTTSDQKYTVVRVR